MCELTMCPLCLCGMDSRPSPSKMALTLTTKQLYIEAPELYGDNRVKFLPQFAL